MINTVNKSQVPVHNHFLNMPFIITFPSIFISQVAPLYDDLQKEINYLYKLSLYIIHLYV
jgi:hypothetical protein